MILRDGKYKVVWTDWGWSYAKCRVYVRSKFLGIGYWRNAGAHGSAYYEYVIHTYSEESLQHWFERAIDSYEKHVVETQKIKATSLASKHYKWRFW